MDLEALQNRLRQFAAERDWQPLHTPKNLAMALVVEAAELAELFQWLTPEQSQAARSDTGLQRRIGDELADVLLYLVQIADHSGVDLERAVAGKLLSNARKHPPTRPGRPAGTAPPPRQTHVLLDYENVQPDDAALRALVPGVTDLWLFHGPHQKRVDALFESFGDRVTRVPIARVGKNSLDFHLSFYVGYIAATHPDARLVVLANDQGYAPMLEHAAALGFEAALVGHARKARPAARTVARKAPRSGQPRAAVGSAHPPRSAPIAAAAAAAPPRHTASSDAPAFAPAMASAPASASASARKTPAGKRPARKAPARKLATATAEGAAAATPAPAAARAKAGAAAARSKPAPQTSTRTASRSAARAAVQAPAATAPEKAAATPPGAGRRSATRPAAKSPAPPSRAARAATAATKPTPEPARRQAPAPSARRPVGALERLAEQLRRLGSDLPKKPAPLRRLVQSLLGAKADDAAVQAALDALTAAGLLRIDGHGAVSYRLAAATP